LFVKQLHYYFEICFVLKFEREKRQLVCFRPLDATNGYDFEASSFLACVPSCEASKVKGKPIREPILVQNGCRHFLQFLWVFFFFSFFLFVAPSSSSCMYCSEKIEKKKRKTKFSVTTHCYTASHREAWVA
jgi:hypothetical protein